METNERSLCSKFFFFALRGNILDVSRAAVSLLNNPDLATAPYTIYTNVDVSFFCNKN